MKLGDVLGLGGVETVLLPAPSRQEPEKPEEKPVSPWGSLGILTLFQILTAFHFLLRGEEHILLVPVCFLCLTGLMWIYCTGMGALGRTGFEMETIAFFLSTLSLAVTASSAPGSVPKQLAAIVLGIVLFLILGVFLRDLERVKKIRWLMAAGAVGLLGLSLVVGQVKYGAANWISILGMSFQPWERPRWSGCFASGTWGFLFCLPGCAWAAWP